MPSERHAPQSLRIKRRVKISCTLGAWVVSKCSSLPDLRCPHMSDIRKIQMTRIAATLRSLREAVHELELVELAQVDHLEGQQTVDTQQSLSECFSKLQVSINEMENALATLAEATGDAGKL